MATTLRWLGQGGYEIIHPDVRVVIDPYFSGAYNDPAARLKREVPLIMTPKELDGALVICTHDHIDHFDAQTLEQTIGLNTEYAMPSECIRHGLRIGLPQERIIRFDIGDVIQRGGMRLRAVFADHTCEDAIGVRMEAEGKDFYFTGDTLFNQLLIDESGKGVDAIFTCINGRLGNMNHEEAAIVAKSIGAKLAVPNHYNMFADNLADPQDFVKAMEGSNALIRVLEYGPVYPLLSLFDKE